ncbi:sigma-70 family RNA polymerase sigma factor [Sphingomonas koreensis]
MAEPTPWVAAFLERRADLIRYFAARVGESEAEDLVQETWLRVAALPLDTDIHSPGAFIYRLGHNIMLDRIRQDRSRARRDAEWRRAHRVETSSGEDIHDAVPADEALIARERLRRMQEALTQLPEPVQQTFRLHKLEGLSHSQVATRLGVSRSLVEKRMMQALKHLLARLGQ